MRPRNGSGSGNERGQPGPSFQSERDSASAMLVGQSKRPRSTVEEGGRPGCDRPPWPPPPRPQYWNIDTTSLYAAFAERTACFFRPFALRRLRFSYRIVLRSKAIEKSGPTYLSLYLTWRFARPTLYPSVSVRKMDEGLTELRRRTSEPIWRERGRERHARTTRISRDR